MRSYLFLFFQQQFEANKDKYNITDWAITNTTLEEVFLKISLGEMADEQPNNNTKTKKWVESEDEKLQKKKAKVVEKEEESSNETDDKGKGELSSYHSSTSNDEQ